MKIKYNWACSEVVFTSTLVIFDDFVHDFDIPITSIHVTRLMNTLNGTLMKNRKFLITFRILLIPTWLIYFSKVLTNVICIQWCTYPVTPNSLSESSQPCEIRVLSVTDTHYIKPTNYHLDHSGFFHSVILVTRIMICTISGRVNVIR